MSKYIYWDDFRKVFTVIMVVVTRISFDKCVVEMFEFYLQPSLLRYDYCSSCRITLIHMHAPSFIILNRGLVEET